MFVYLGDNMGLSRPPAFLDPTLTEDIILEKGVNYASGGGGILNETGGYFVSCSNLNVKILALRLILIACNLIIKMSIADSEVLTLQAN